MTAPPAARAADAAPARPRHRRRTAVVLSGAAVALVLAALAGVWVGALPLPPGAVLATLADRALAPLGVDVPGGLEGTEAAVLLQLRLPRVVLCALVGGGLAVSGAAYQGVFRNPLADPYLLGAAAGAGLGATLVIAAAPAASLGPVGVVPLAAFVGALLGVGAALLLGTAAGGSSSATLLLAGVAVASFLAAAQTLVQQQNTDDLREVYGWLLGQLGRAQWSDVVLVLPHLGVACLVLLLSGRALDVLAVGDDEARSLGAEVMARLELTGPAGRLVATLSGGEQQRAVLARALAQQPRVLLLDEPTAALDLGHAQQVLDLVDRLRRQDDLTVLSTLHDLTLAGQYADRLALLSRGRVVAEGTPAEVLTPAALAGHYGARAEVVAGPHGPAVLPLRAPEDDRG